MKKIKGQKEVHVGGNIYSIYLKKNKLWSYVDVAVDTYTGKVRRVTIFHADDNLEIHVPGKITTTVK